MTTPLINYEQPLGQVRLLIPDVAPVTQGRLPDSVPVLIFTDEQIESFLAMNGGNVKRAAADAIDTVATDEALLSKVIKTEDLQTDGAKLLEALRKRAAALRSSADEDDARDHDFVTYPGRCAQNYVYFGLHLQE